MADLRVYIDSKYDVSESVIIPIKLEDSVSQAAVKLSLDLMRVSGLPELDGAHISVRQGKRLWFFGHIFVIKRKDRVINITAYDPLLYLVKNKDDFYFKKGTTTRKAIDTICRRAGIKPKLLPAGKYTHRQTLDYRADKYDSYYSVLASLLTEDKKNTKKSYWIRYDNGLKVYERSRPKNVPVLSEGITDAQVERSNEDRKNYVRARNRERRADGIAKSTTSIKKYGRLSTYIKSDATNDADARREAKKVLDRQNRSKVTRSFRHIATSGTQRFFSGDYAYIKSKDDLIAHGYYFDNVKYEIYPNHVVMDADAVVSTSLPSISYEKPDVQKKQDGLGNTTESIKGIRLKFSKGWVATAYNPALGGINGTGTTASGNKFKTKRSIAVDPKLIPMGSVVYIKCRAKPEYSGIYLAEDVGGAIKGKRIDMGLPAKECIPFGRRDVEISILEKGLGRADARQKAGEWDKIRSHYKVRIQNGKTTPSKSNKAFIRPMSGGWMGRKQFKTPAGHFGIDILIDRAKTGKVRLHPVADGTVTRSGWSTSYGWVVYIVHSINGQTWESVYAHIHAKPKVKVGQKVTVNTTIGYVGNTGWSDWPHLHFELHRGRWTYSKSHAVNPHTYINF